MRRTISLFAAVVVFITTYALVLPAITMEKTAGCGIEEHQHDDSCYEDQLICGQEESADHQHTADCYERVLVCGKEAHTHSEACYPADAGTYNEGTATGDTTGDGVNVTVDNSEGGQIEVPVSNLSDGIEGSDSSDESAQLTDSFLTEAPAAMETDSTAAAYPAAVFDDVINVRSASLTTDTEVGAADGLQNLSEETTSLFVHVEADEETFPEGTTMMLSEVTDDTIDSVAAAVEGALSAQDEARNTRQNNQDKQSSPQTQTLTRTHGFHALDISFYDLEGNKIEPLRPVRVSITSDAIRTAVQDETTVPVVVHVENETAQAAASNEASGNPAAEKESDENVTATDVVMNSTVVEAAETTEAAATGRQDEVADIEQTPDTLTFEAGAFSVYAIVYTVDFHWEVDGKSYDFSIPGGGYVSLYDLVKDLGIAEDKADTEKDEIRELIDGVETIEFSKPELVSVSKTEENTTVGAIKDGLGLECDYSADLTEKQIAEINAQEVLAGDWALISLKPFDTEESMTVTMINGETWIVKVTDAQISRDYITADSETYHIEVTLDERENIKGALELSVEEILQGTDLYEEYLYSASEYMFLESVDDISFARFFDITILNDGEKYEPEYPTQVAISYQDAIDIAGDENLKIIHFANTGTEIIDEVELKENKGNGTTVLYEQSGFSVTGTVVTNANSIVNGQRYVIYTQSGNNYYAISHASDGRDKDTVYPVKLDQGSVNNNATVSAQNAGSNIVWNVTKVGSNYRFSYEAGGNTYYLRTYGGLMVGADSDINESEYWNTNRYTWTYDSSRHLRALSSGNDNNRYLGYSDNVIKERVHNNTNQFYFARVTDVSDIIPTIHYVDESGEELTVVNGRDWSEDAATSPAFLIYDIDGYEYVKTTLSTVNGTEIRPILRRRALWQYTTSTLSSSSITWTDIPVDAQDSGRLEDIYVVYKTAAEPVTGGVPKVKESGNTENPVDPAIYKSSTSNGDGTNTIGLSITADTSPLEVEKLADVIVIFDVSTSMRREMANDTQHDNNNTTAVNCNHKTRLWIAHNAVKDLADTLIGDQTEFKDSAGNKLIRMSLISFSDKATEVQKFTDNYSTYASAVEYLHTNTGTNWEDALRMANQMAVDSERATFVIFVTDGNPSYRATRGNLLNLDGYPDTVNDSNIDIYADNTYYKYRANTIFGKLDEYDERNYNTTLDVAKSIVDHNKNYYAIGVGPTSGVTRLQGLTTYAYGGDSNKGADRTKNATDSEELAQAFSDITASIVALLGWGDITMTDGITSLSNTVDKGHLVNVDGSFEYWKAEAPAGWDNWSKNVRSGYILGTSGKEITYPDDYNSWSSDERNLYASAYNQGKNLAESNPESWESWDPASENCEEAVYDEASGSVKWDMGHRFVPETGCTYRVSFRVWPSQEAYDILAKCKNDPTFYDTLTEAQKAQIIRTGSASNYSYTLKTNDKDPSTTYKAAKKTGDGVETTGETKTLKFNDVQPLNLASDMITVKKEWDNSLGDGRTPAPVKLGVQAAGMDDPETAGKDESIFAIINVSEDGSWTGSANISTGLMEVENEKQIIYEHGHDFTVTEDVDADARYHWELTADTYRPMVITDPDKGYNEPTTVMLKKVSSSESYDYEIDGGYYKIQTDTAVLTATNHRRSNLNLIKKVVDTSGTEVASTQLFEFTIRVDDPTITQSTQSAADGQDIWFSVQTDPNDTFTVVKDLVVTGAKAEMQNGSRTGFFHVSDNTEFTVKMQPGWNLRIINLPSGTSYTMTETDVTGYTFVGASVDNGGTFTVTEGTTTGNGTIDEANKQYTVTYTNRTVTHNVSIWKTDLDHTAITTGAAFELYSADNYDDAAGKPKQGAEPLVSGTTGTNGILTLGAVPVGEYRLVETRAPEGYMTASSAIQISVRESDVTAMQGNTIAEVAQDVEGNPYRQYWVAGQAEGTYQVRVWNNPGVELPSTGGPGTRLFTILGTALIAGAGILLWMSRKSADFTK